MKMPPPDEYAASQPAINISWAELWAKLRDYCLSNVAAAMLTVWGILLFVGGLIFLVHFYSIRFMPELNPQASITLLATSTLTAGFLLILTIVFLFAPVVLWKSLLFNNPRLQVLWYKNEQFVPRRAMLCVFLPFVGIVGSIIFAIFLTSWWGIEHLWIIVPLVISLIGKCPRM